MKQNNSNQKVKIEKPVNINTTIVNKKKVIKFPSEENKPQPKRKSVFDRLVKNVGNISVKVVPKKWSEKKVKCTSL